MFTWAYTFFFIKIKEGEMLFVCLDDLIYIGNDKTMFEKFKRSIMAEFNMYDLGKLHYFFGFEVIQSNVRILISQKNYVQEIVEKFWMKNCNLMSTPTEFDLELNNDHKGKKVDDTLYKQIIGSLMYLTSIRLDT
jgi:hypothetical protein